MTALTPQVAARDTQAYVDFLERRSGLDTGRLATTGYCMGGAMSLRAAAQLPDQVRAAASFHGGNLAPDEQTGPQHNATRIRDEVYAAHADQDPSMPPEQIARLEQALEEAGGRCCVEPGRARLGSKVVLGQMARASSVKAAVSRCSGGTSTASS